MATTETRTFPVEGFHCTGCSANLGKNLQLVEGVIRADARFDTAEVTVRYDSERVTDEDIRDQIRAAGFGPA